LLFKIQSLAEVLQVGKKLARRLITFVAIFPESLLDNPFELGRYFRTVARQRHRLSTENRDQHVGIGWSFKRLTARDHFVKDHAETPDVCAWIDRQPAR